MILFLILTSLYSSYFLWNCYYWLKIPKRKISQGFKPGVSILVPIRNESENLRSLFESLSNQQHPEFEVLIIDDHSEDQSFELSKSLFNHYQLPGKIVRLSENRTGKKQAITFGIQHAQYPIILTTDGDCIAGNQWVTAMVSAFKDPSIQFVAGPVKMQSSDLLTNLQAIEFSGLIGAGAASLRAGFPGMCNGANMAYRKSTFEEVGGYTGNLQIASGDDEFLLQKIHKKHPGKAVFLKADEAIVQTPAKKSMGELMTQRKRWSSKWKYHKSWFIKAMAIGIFTYSLMTVIAWSSLFFPDKFSAHLFLLAIVIKALAEGIFIMLPGNFLKIQRSFIGAIALSIIYPFFVTFLGIASIFGQYSWKGRAYQ